MSTTVGEPVPRHLRYILRPPPMSTSPPGFLASVAATTTTRNRLTKITTRKKKHARKEIAILIARHKRLLLLSASDFDLFRSKDLFATKLISLTVPNGKPQQIELSIFVHLKLDKSLCHVIQIDYGSKLARRHKGGHENVAVPRHKLELSAGCLDFHDESIVVQSQHRFAEARIDEIAGERCERRKRSWIGRLGKLLGCRLKSGFGVFKILRNGIVFRVAKNPIQYPRP